MSRTWPLVCLLLLSMGACGSDSADDTAAGASGAADADAVGLQDASDSLAADAPTSDVGGLDVLGLDGGAGPGLLDGAAAPLDAGGGSVDGLAGLPDGEVADTDPAGSADAGQDTAEPDVAASQDITTAQDGGGIDGGDGGAGGNAGDAGSNDAGCQSGAAALWDKTLAHTSGDPVRVAAMDDGGMAVVTTVSAQVDVWRLTSNGDVAWTQTLKAPEGLQANAIAPVAGASAFLVGQRGSGKTAQGWMARLDPNGALQWDKTVQYADTFNGATVLSDGPMTDVTVVAGAPASVAWHPRPGVPTQIQSTLTWFDATGKITAQDGIFLGGSTRAEAIGPWENGGLVVAGTGYTYSADGDIFVVTWVAPAQAGGTHGIVQVFPSPGQDRVSAVVSLGKGRVAVAGQRTVGGATSLLLTLLDGTGKSVSVVDKFWPKAPATAAHAMWLTGLGGLVIAAEASTAAQLGTVASESWVLGLSTLGDLQWERSLGIAAVADHLADVAILPGDKLALAGAAGGKLRALRTSPWGHPGCAEAGKCGPLTLKDCDDTNQCTAVVCEALSGCVNPTVPDGSVCAGGTCQAGACKP